MRLFGGERMLSVFNALKVPDNEQIQHKMLSGAIEKAQKKIEGNNFGIRKQLLEYDQVMNEQREIIYGERRAGVKRREHAGRDHEDGQRRDGAHGGYVHLRRADAGRVGI